MKLYRLVYGSGTLHLYDGNTEVSAADWNALFQSAGSALFKMAYTTYAKNSQVIKAPSGGSPQTKQATLSGRNYFAYGMVYKATWNANTGNFTSFVPYNGKTLSEDQIKFLMTHIKNAEPISGASAPTTSTVGTVGKLYVDTTAATAYICVEADSITPSYTWKQITA